MLWTGLAHLIPDPAEPEMAEAVLGGADGAFANAFAVADDANDFYALVAVHGEELGLLLQDLSDIAQHGERPDDSIPDPDSESAAFLAMEQGVVVLDALQTYAVDEPNEEPASARP